MAKQENKIPLSKKGGREISEFLGHELLYDYLTGNLDKDRDSAVAEHVKFSRDAQLDLAKIQIGQSYAEKLSKTVVSPSIISKLSVPTNYFAVLLAKANFEKWPQGLKWGLEALAVSLIIVIGLMITPWQKVLNIGIDTGKKVVVLAEISKTATNNEIQEKPEFIDEGFKEVQKTDSEKLPGPEVAVKPPAVVVLPPKPTIEASAQAAKSPSKPPVPADPSAQQATSVVDVSQSQSPTAGSGFLYRGEIAVTNLEVVGPKITEKIGELGGRKAGSVELGWKKNPDSMYYHFTIPEAKYQELLTFLAIYGKPKLGKEKHSRVMPDGIVRLILLVDEAKK